jgi:DNA helicase-2/ATP-dependent DNA helicase PcrA
MKKVKPDFPPTVIFCDDPANALRKLKEANPNTLILHLLNRERFIEINAFCLYQAYDKMEKYSFGKTYSAVDVLTTVNDDNPDPLLKMLYNIAEMFYQYKKHQYGLIIQNLKRHKYLFNNLKVG